MENNMDNLSRENAPDTTKTKKNSKIILICVLAVLVLIIATGGFFAFDIIKDVKGGGSTERVTVEIEPDETIDSVAGKLKKSGLIKYEFAFKLYAQMKNKHTAFTDGKHKIEGNLGYGAILLSLHKEKEITYKVTLPEGFTQKEIVERLSTVTPWQDEDLLDAINKFDISEYDFLQGLPQRESRLEGYIFPDTYLGFLENATADTFLKLSLEEFQRRIKKNDIEEKAKALGMTLDEVVILASIIQEEVADTENMQKVSAVFHNRLNIDMKLESCVTVLYALGTHKETVTYADTEVESPYNTYHVKGLPKGPICCPGEEALLAAVTPDQSFLDEGYLFFYQPPNSDVIYSKTFAQHSAAIKKYRGGKGTAAAQ